VHRDRMAPSSQIGLYIISRVLNLGFQYRIYDLRAADQFWW
jgi:hypothetical protein